jgi:hypothetical protein
MQKIPDNSTTLAAFIAPKAEIHTILARLIALSGKHSDIAPDDPTWAHVGTSASHLEGLRRGSDAG